MNRVFVLSPAHSGGRRAAMLTRPHAAFELAKQVQIGAAALGDVFAFCSGLYFRGKLAYSRTFARPPEGIEGIQIITSSRGLVSPSLFVGMDELREFASVAVDAAEERFTGALRASLADLAKAGNCEVVLLGSIATGKYVDTLLPALGERLIFPAEFVGRGDMSRGALMLRSAALGQELTYIPVAGAIRRGQRPPRLAPMPRVRE